MNKKIKLCGKKKQPKLCRQKKQPKKDRKKSYDLLLLQIQAQRAIEDIENLKKQPKQKIHELLVNNIKNDYLNQSQDVIIQVLNLINKEINTKKILDEFLPKEIQVNKDIPLTIEINNSCVHRDKVITGILNQMSQEIPPKENVNNQKMLLVKRILKYVENKICWSLGQEEREEQYSILSTIPQEESIFSTISDEELDIIEGEKRVLQRQWGKPIPKEYNMSKMFEDNLKENIDVMKIKETFKGIKNIKKIPIASKRFNQNWTKRDKKKLSKLFTVSQYDNKHIPKLNPL